MRLDYVSYVIAIILFIVTGVALSVIQSLWIVTTAVIGLVFVGLGYTQRPKIKVAPTTANVPSNVTNVLATVPPPPPSTPAQPVVAEPVKVEEAAPIIQPQPPKYGLTEIKGIKEKRAAQLRAIGINNIEDLSKASDKDLAAKLNISPKITIKWIENAKEIGQKT